MFESRTVFIGDELISRMRIPTTGESRSWDTQLRGFLVRVWPSGRKVFYIRLRIARRTEFRMIGEFGQPWTTDAARKKAAELLQVARGYSQSKVRLITVNELCNRYLGEGPLTKVLKRSSSWRTDATNLRRHVQPLLGRRYVNELTRLDIARMVKDVTDGVTAADIKTKRRGLARVRGGSGSAARVKTTLAAMFSWAMKLEIIDKNPAIGVEVAKSRLMERFLTDNEAMSLQQFLTAASASGSINSSHADAIRLLLLTGARKSEILGLRWSEFEDNRSRLAIPPERTKSGRHNGMRYIPLGKAAVAILRNIPRTSEHVFPAGRPGRSEHITDIKKTWVRVRRECNLGDMRIHDLRHSFASFAIGGGESIYTISAALGHATTRMTERYLHLRNEEIIAMAERTTQRITGDKSELRLASDQVSLRGR
jgi:integrase